MFPGCRRTILLKLHFATCRKKVLWASRPEFVERSGRAEKRLGKVKSSSHRLQFEIRPWARSAGETHGSTLVLSREGSEFGSAQRKGTNPEHDVDEECHQTNLKTCRSSHCSTLRIDVGTIITDVREVNLFMEERPDL